MNKSQLIYLIVIAAFCLLPPSWGAGATPKEEIKKTVDSVLNILQDQSEQAKEKGRQRLREVIYPRFDFAEMAKRALGSHWNKLKEEERQEFVAVFREVLEGAYVDAIESYQGEKVIYTGEVQENERAEVKTTIADKKGEKYLVDYRLHLKDGVWRVYDVVIENVSLVNNYRSQFRRVIAQSSYDDLVRKLKNNKLNAGQQS